MIDCRKCGFSIEASMRHALVKNCCPACGSAILGEIQVQRLRLFKQRLLQQEFSQDISDDLIFDITLFMLLEFSPIAKSEDEEPDAPSEPEVPLDLKEEETEEGDYEKIRDQIREEVMANVPDAPEDADEDLKIARLKRIAKESKVRLSGTSVRRLNSD